LGRVTPLGTILQRTGGSVPRSFFWCAGHGARRCDWGTGSSACFKVYLNKEDIEAIDKAKCEVSDSACEAEAKPDPKK